MFRCYCCFFGEKDPLENPERKNLLPESPSTPKHVSYKYNSKDAGYNSYSAEDSGCSSVQSHDDHPYNSSSERSANENTIAATSYQYHDSDLQYEHQINTNKNDGAFSNVYKGILKTSIPVAIKTPKPKDLEANTKRLARELSFFEKLSTNKNHPYAKYIVFFHGTVIKNESIHLVLGYCNGGSLSDRIRQKDCPSWSDWKIHRLAEVAKGLAYLHSHDIIHADFKTSNVLIHKEQSVIIDFNLSKVNPSPPARGDGSPLYFSPEHFLNSPLSLKADIYAFGLVFIEVHTGKNPYRHHHFTQEEKLKDYVAVQKKTDIPPKDLEEPLQKLVKQCLLFQPRLRPTAEEIVTNLENHIKTLAASTS